MSTVTNAGPAATADTGEVDVACQIDARAQKIHAALQAAEQKKPLNVRTKPAVLWRQARREAVYQVGREQVRDRTKRAARSAVTSARSEARSVIHRNRKQLVPWMIAAPYAATGEAAHLLATYGSGSPVAISAAAAATTAGASLVAWRKRIARRTPGKFRQKMQASLGLLCGWTTVMPLIPTSDQAGMWLALLGGTAWMGLSWWRDHQHPIPLAGDVENLEVPAPQEQDCNTTDNTPEDNPGFGAQVLSDWDTYVTGQGTLPGSCLSRPRRIPYGWTFLVHLVRGKQQLETARAARKAIAEALNLDPGMVSFDHDDRPGADRSVIVMTIRTEDIDNTYTGPTIIREGGDVSIEIGPYQDGDGSELFHVLADQLTDEQLASGERPRGSMNGGFLLGTKGSGKSRILELIAVGLRALGVEIWYLDPQEGKSSPAIMAEAEWPLSGMHGARGAYSNVVDLWQAIGAVCEVREAEGAVAGETGFQHTRQRPAIMVIIDECHQVFQAENPETGQSFGAEAAQLDRIMRKNGIGLLGASQAITQDTFGRGNLASVLRDGMCASNVLLLAYGGKNLRLAPGYDDQPCADLPLSRGYGFNPKGNRPQTRFQARYTPDFQPWLADYPQATLDTRVQKRIGNTYLRRFEQYAEDTAAKRALLAEIDAAEGDASTLPAFGAETSQQPQEEGQPATVTSLLSPQQRRMQTTTTATPPAAGALTGAEQTTLTMLAQEPQTPTTLGRALGITSQAAGRRLRSITAKGHAVQMDDGRYMAK